jgi:hypothetical protein
LFAEELTLHRVKPEAPAIHLVEPEPPAIPSHSLKGLFACAPKKSHVVVNPDACASFRNAPPAPSGDPDTACHSIWGLGIQPHGRRG